MTLHPGMGQTQTVLRLLALAMAASAVTTGIVVLQVRAESEQAMQASLVAAEAESGSEARQASAAGFKDLSIVDNGLAGLTRVQVAPDSDVTVAETLSALGFSLDRPDVVYPAREEPAPWYGRIYIQRAPGVVLKFDDTVRELKTGAATVEQLLAEQKVVLDQDDRVEPDKPTAIAANMVVRVVRVETKEELEQEEIGFETQVNQDDGRYVGEEVVATAGAAGTKQKKFKVTYEDGKEVSRELVGEEVIHEPTTKVVLKGTKARPVESKPTQSGPAVGPFADLINDAAAKYGQSAQELMSVMLCESGGYRWADNGAGNLGLFQFSQGMWSESWNSYRDSDIFGTDQIYAAAQAWSLGMRGRWGC